MGEIVKTISARMDVNLDVTQEELDAIRDDEDGQATEAVVRNIINEGRYSFPEYFIYRMEDV
jgi:hypothetical protein